MNRTEENLRRIRDAFREEEHPRDECGRFSEKEGGAAALQALAKALRKSIWITSDAEDIGGMTKETEAALQEGAAAVEQNYTFLKPVAGGVVHSVVLNQRFNWRGDLRELNEMVRKEHDRGRLAARDVQGLMVHELAHVLTYQHCKSLKEIENLDRELDSKFQEGISGYADRGKKWCRNAG